jgi:hypothetical protein
MDSVLKAIAAHFEPWREDRDRQSDPDTRQFYEGAGSSYAHAARFVLRFVDMTEAEAPAEIENAAAQVVPQA